MLSHESVPKADLSPSLRHFLFLTAAINGAVIMIVEILGAKLLSPYVGTSHFVWTAQIAVTLMALAFGYWAGGNWVHRSADLRKLYGAVLGAALWLALCLVICEPVANFALSLPSLAVGTLIASAVLFFVPLALLATTGPFLVQVFTRSVAAVGSNVGRLSAVSTLGSFVGTILIGYVLVPLLPNSKTLMSVVLVLAFEAVAYFVLWGKGRQLAVVLILGGLSGAIGLAGVGLDLRHRAALGEIAFANSNFGQLQVIDRQRDGMTLRMYLNDYLMQNSYEPTQGISLSAFPYLLNGFARSYQPAIHQVLCLGLGVGIVPMQFAREGAEVDAVEINPAVIPLAAKYFGFNPAWVRVYEGDARQYVRRCAKQYDCVVLDAFLGDSTPVHLMSKEAFHAIGKVLKPEGVLVMNTFAKTEAGQDFFANSLYQTLQSVFGTVALHRTEDGKCFYAALLVSGRKPVIPPGLLAGYVPMIRQQYEWALTNVPNIDPRHGIVLTDDFNPVEYHDASNREATRRRIVANALQR
ncbi:MAG: methyltransferase domain-containing protein [Pedosphaera sp.]|nr:methyltransferase domain-containing protein [Pedosphaera sp.]